MQVEPEAASLNQNAEKTETPTLGENLKNDGANHVTNSRVEDQTNAQTNVVIPNLEASSRDKNNDTPNCNTEFLKPATAESAVNFSNQGIKTLRAWVTYVGFSFPGYSMIQYFHILMNLYCRCSGGFYNSKNRRMQ